MNRRGFLKGFVGVVAGAALVEELSTKSIFLPPRGGWRSGHDRSMSVQCWIQAQWEPALQETLAKYERAVMTEGFNAGAPQFLTNYVDPEIIEALIKPPKMTFVYLRMKP